MKAILLDLFADGAMERRGYAEAAVITVTAALELFTIEVR